MNGEIGLGWEDVRCAGLGWTGLSGSLIVVVSSISM